MAKSAFSKYKHDVRYHLVGKHNWDKAYALFWLNGQRENLRNYFLSSVPAFETAKMLNDRKNRDA